MPSLPRLAAVPVLALCAACARVAAPEVRVVPPEPEPPPRTEQVAEPVVVPDLPAPPALAREFRAAWISPVWGGEWPSRPDLGTAAQQRELANLLDRAQQVGLNAVVLHVRVAGDALYPSTRAPWSVYLTGRSGRAPEPYYDPLAYAIEEAHRRGLELHVWFNPFRAAPPDRAFEPGAGHVLKERPEWVVRYGRQQWIDPGRPAARAAVLAAILEVVERYDIDGVHLDDYFYPYREEVPVTTRVRSGGRMRTVRRMRTLPFPDDATWRRYGEGRFENRADWRRHNIDSFVEELYRAVKTRRPWVSVGISPFGIWRPDHPQGITGLNAYAEIYADARRWWREGWVDYLSPQLYWPLDGEQSRFTRLDAWWRAENERQRHLWPGLYTSRETDLSPAWANGEIVRQVDTLRAVRNGGGEADGHIHFRLQALRPAARGGLGDMLRTSLYQEPALVPAMPWLGAEVPAAPRAHVTGAAGAARIALRITPGNDVPLRWWLVQVLGQDGWSSSLYPAAEADLELASPPGVRAVALSALSRTGVQSPPVVHALPES